MTWFRNGPSRNFGETLGLPYDTSSPQSAGNACEAGVWIAVAALRHRFHQVLRLMHTGAMTEKPCSCTWKHCGISKTPWDSSLNDQCFHEIQAPSLNTHTPESPKIQPSSQLQGWMLYTTWDLKEKLAANVMEVAAEKHKSGGSTNIHR